MGLKFRYLYRAFRYRLFVDPGELRFVSESLGPGQAAVDVGCHKGAYTYWMRRRVGPSGAVYAFEPQPEQIAYLREAFSAMSYDNVEIVPLAVSDHCGAMTLHVPAGLGKTHHASLEESAEERGARSEQRNSAGESRSSLLAPRNFAVDVTTLDDFFGAKARGPDFLKIDVEGHELAVLQGGVETIRKYRPRILVECEVRHRPDHDARPVFELLESLGYEGTFFLHRKRRPLAEFDAAVHQKLETPDPIHLPRGYVNNFAFVPR